MIFECLEKDEEYVKKTIKEAMVSISKSEHHMFSIPLEVNVNSGYNWGYDCVYPSKTCLEYVAPTSCEEITGKNTCKNSDLGCSWSNMFMNISLCDIPKKTNTNQQMYLSLQLCSV